ncbi:MAG: hypothetical protein GKR87_04290 [Kiritimatiellae bacterium]|nr:hypothetical protein [Kiritimatiellia bacterium]
MSTIPCGGKDRIWIKSILFVVLGIVSLTLYAGAITYTYDDSYRLKGVHYNKGHILYRYDRNNNVTKEISQYDSDGDGLDDDWETSNFRTITAAHSTSDSDGDGASDVNESSSGTDPNDPNSSLRLIDMGSGSGLMVSWSSESNFTYRIERSSDLVLGPFVPIQNNMIPTPPMNIYVDMTATNEGPWFYRIAVEQ